jgi:hypothetical protein
MSAVNGAGYEVQALDNRMGWRRASKIMGTQAEAEAALKAMNDRAAADAAARGTVDKVERRWFESLNAPFESAVANNGR